MDQKKGMARLGLWFDVLKAAHFPPAESDRFCDSALAFALGLAGAEDLDTILSRVDETGVGTTRLALAIVSFVGQRPPLRLSDAAYRCLCRVAERIMGGDEDGRCVLCDGDAFLRPLAFGAAIKRSDRFSALMSFCLRSRVQDVFVRDASSLADVAMQRALWHLALRPIDTGSTAVDDASAQALELLTRLAGEAVWRSYLLPWAVEFVRHVKHEAVCRLLLLMLQGPSVAFTVHLERSGKLDTFVTQLRRSACGSAAGCLARLQATWPQRVAGASQEQGGVASAFTCPITLCPCRFPARASDGFVYERDMIMAVLCTTKISPLTREPLLPILLTVQSA